MNLLLVLVIVILVATGMGTALLGSIKVTLARNLRIDEARIGGLLAAFGLTLIPAMFAVGFVSDLVGRQPVTIGGSILFAVSLAVLAQATGYRMVLAATVLLSAAWSWSASTNPSLNATLPQAGPQQGTSVQTFGSAAFDDGTPQLAAWLKSHGDADATWQLVVSSSQNASTLIAEYKVSVLALGGFSGTDNTISVAGFADLVSSGAARYVLVGQGGGGGSVGALGDALFGARADGRLGDTRQQSVGAGGFGGAAASGPNPVMSAVQSACTLVSDSSLPTRYQSVLYDCADAADAIRAAGN